MLPIRFRESLLPAVLALAVVTTAGAAPGGDARELAGAAWRNALRVARATGAPSPKLRQRVIDAIARARNVSAAAAARVVDGL